MCKIYVFLFCVILVQHVSRVNGLNIGNEVCLESQSGPIRLFGLNSSYVGYVQVCKGGYWTPISYEEEDEWTRKNSMVTCRELGFQGNIKIFSQKEFSPGMLASLLPLSRYYSVECTGLEEQLVNCTWSIKDVKTEKKDVMVLCREDPYGGEVTVLGISGKDNEGIVALYDPLKTHRWSTICTTEWDDADADVACKQLGFKGGSSTSYSLQQAVDIKLVPNKQCSHFQCSGTERQLNECWYSTTFPYQSCSSEYAGIVCITEPKDTHDDSNASLIIALLIVMIGIILLLIAILLLVLRYTVKRFGSKPRAPSNQDIVSARRRHGQTRIIHTRLDPDMPYAVTAPPSYGDTVLADRRLGGEVAEDDESRLISGDVLSNNTNNTSIT